MVTVRPATQETRCSLGSPAEGQAGREVGCGGRCRWRLQPDSLPQLAGTVSRSLSVHRAIRPYSDTAPHLHFIQKTLV
ncbi:hypothetical protein E2C01_044233 [Portunus trituberculatus]|uniref:Uncharacterized protein n=1 Tax=Portunus trituberculatus TaxID=210409 RepID=A0A5B7FYI2_PORTR|nr:hypothetical protein [Portunus trituberculatus]